jgi:hypothetical protein
MTTKTPQDIWDQYAAGLPLDSDHSVSHHTDRDPNETDFVHDGEEQWERKGGESDWTPVKPMGA